MNLDDFGRVADAALAQIENLLADWFPNGVREGNEFLIGSRDGEAGRSMRIRLSGVKAGYWSDFAADEAGRDMISLYAYIQGLKQGQACAQLAEELGVSLALNSSDHPKEKKPNPNPHAQKRQAPAQAKQGVEEKKPRTEWEPILPVPDDAGPYPVAHIKRGRRQIWWEYRDQEGRLLGVVYRFMTSDGGKEVLPCVFARHRTTGERKWHWITWQDPRPLYLKGRLRPELDVLVVEGEKCVDAAHGAIGAEYDVMSWPGGGNQVGKADWSPIRGRRVKLWADADAKVYKKNHAKAGQIKPESEQPGMSTMCHLAEILIGLGCEVEFVDIPSPGEKPDGWDVADLLAEGGTLEDLRAWLGKLRAPIVHDALPAESCDIPLEPDIPEWVLRDSVGRSTANEAGASILDWKSLYQKLIKTERELVKGCRENVYMGLIHDPDLVGIVALDQFSQLQVKLRRPPWPSELGEWTEADDFYLGMFMAKRYYCTVGQIGEIEKAVAQAARERAFDPVKDYFNTCAEKWDGSKRVETALSTYWGTADTEYTRLIARMFLVGLVMRAFKPGVKHDYAPVFEGGQGEGKSTALAILGGDWFADTAFRMGDKDGYLSIQGILLYEISELEHFNKSEVTAVKAFMSSANDRYREPYGRRIKKVPRRTCFAATTNQDAYFKDPSGNRRFWPIKVGMIDLDSLRRDRDQLLGEAVHLMRAGVLWYPTREQQRRLLDPQQSDREIPHEWIGRLYDYVEGIDSETGRPVSANRIERVTSRELITKALHIEIGKLSAMKRETMDVSACMAKLGWIKKRYTEGAREHYFERPPEENPHQGKQDQGGEDDYVPL